MSCESYDWKAYGLGELSREERRQAEAHAAVCSACKHEMAALRGTLDAMAALRQEEIPRRIAFVSDKVFEPRWFHKLLHPTFAAACVLAAAIVGHALLATSTAEVDAAVAKAVLDIEARQRAEMMAAYEMLDKQFKQMYVTTAGIVRQ
jgi:anti-sigma factor RsiW